MKNWAITSVIKAKTAAEAVKKMKESDVISVKKINLVPTQMGERMEDCIGFSGSVDPQDFEEIEEESKWGFK